MVEKVLNIAGINALISRLTYNSLIVQPLLCCKTRARPFIFPHFLSLQGKSEEEVSSAGEQLTSNRIYDGENTKESFFNREALFCGYHCPLWLKKLIFDYLA
jgi:hypothetical protein